jgi:hypothetical protein
VCRKSLEGLRRAVLRLACRSTSAKSCFAVLQGAAVYLRNKLGTTPGLQGSGKTWFIRKAEVRLPRERSGAVPPKIPSISRTAHSAHSQHCHLTSACQASAFILPAPLACTAAEKTLGVFLSE